LQTDPNATENVPCNSSPSAGVESNSGSDPILPISEEQVGNSGNTHSNMADYEAVLAVPQETVMQHPMKTRLQDNIVKNRTFTDGTVRYPQKGRGFACVKTEQNSTTALSAVSVTEPGDLQQALADPG
jgi:deoxyxylulose-5-phosphate synthase